MQEDSSATFGVATALFLEAVRCGHPMPSSVATASSGSCSAAAVRFSRRCAIEDMAGICRMLGDRRSSYANATCIGVATSLAATSDNICDWSGLKPPRGIRRGRCRSRNLPATRLSRCTGRATDNVIAAHLRMGGNILTAEHRACPRFCAIISSGSRSSWAATQN